MHQEQRFIGQADAGGVVVDGGVAGAHGLGDGTAGEVQALLPGHGVVDIGQGGWRLHQAHRGSGGDLRDRG